MRPVSPQLAMVTAVTLFFALAPEASAAGRTPSTPRPENVYLITGQPCADTLSVPWRAVFGAAQSALTHDDWRIERADTTAHVIVTEWKPLKQALARIIVGSVDARCKVQLTPLGPRSTLVVFYGYIASPKSLEENPRLRVGQHAYWLAAQDWHSEVKDLLGVPRP